MSPLQQALIVMTDLSGPFRGGVGGYIGPHNLGDILASGGGVTKVTSGGFRRTGVPQSWTELLVNLCFSFSRIIRCKYVRKVLNLNVKELQQTSSFPDMWSIKPEC